MHDGQKLVALGFYRQHGTSPAGAARERSGSSSLLTKFDRDWRKHTVSARLINKCVSRANGRPYKSLVANACLSGAFAS